MLSSAQITGAPVALRTSSTAHSQRQPNAFTRHRTCATAAHERTSCSDAAHPSMQHVQTEGTASRRSVLLTGAAAAAGLLSSVQQAAAVQGITAGRLPGVSNEVDANGYRTYQRPEGKSGGHGVGWSEIPRYSFKIPDGWEETPVSIADLGGTEIDLRYASDKQGDVIVIVAPVLRFLDIGFNANVSLEELGPPDKLITGFAPELIGGPLLDGAVVETDVVKKEGHTYYQWELEVMGSNKPHRLVAATATGNRVFLLGVSASGRQWHKAKDLLKNIQESFYVPPKEA